MEYEKTCVERLEEEKIIRFENTPAQKVIYLEVKSKQFQCHQYHELTPKLIREVSRAPYLANYLKRRRFLFTKFDEGVEYDEESLYSIIPEAVSLYLKDRFRKCGVKKICEPFSGVGGIAVHLCDSFEQYIVNDLDRRKIKKLKKNLRVYGKSDHLIKCYETDFLQINPFATDALIICPPWGGINVAEYGKRNLDEIMKPKLSDILNHAFQFSSNILLQMPKTTKIENFIDIYLQCPKASPFLTVQKILRNDKVEQLFIYIGDPKFTGISNHVNEMVYRDLGLLGQAQKVLRKKVKDQLRFQPLSVMSEVYAAVQTEKPEEELETSEEPPNNELDSGTP